MPVCGPNSTTLSYLEESLTSTLDHGLLSIESNPLLPGAPDHLVVLSGTGSETTNSVDSGTCAETSSTTSLGENQVSFQFEGKPIFTNGNLTEIDFFNLGGDNTFVPSGNLTVVQPGHAAPRLSHRAAP